MYEGVSTSVQTNNGDTNDFPIIIDLHQGSTLSSYLFTLILNVLTKHIQKLASRRVFFFTDDIVILTESNKDLNEWLET